MSTAEFNIPEELQKLLGAVGKDLPTKEKQANDVIAGQRAHQDNILTGASVIIQRSLDEIAVEEEKLAQYADIKARKARLAAAILTSVDDAPQAPVVPVAAPVAVVEPVAPASDPTPTGVLPAAPASREPGPYHYSNWSGLAWFFAILFGVIGLIVGIETRDFLDRFSIVAEVILKTMWIGGLTLLGAGIGGFGFTFFTERKRAED